jgi:hypothetical protein
MQYSLSFLDHDGGDLTGLTEKWSETQNMTEKTVVAWFSLHSPNSTTYNDGAVHSRTPIISTRL